MCDQYEGTSQFNIRRLKKEEHEGILYACDQPTKADTLLVYYCIVLEY